MPKTKISEFSATPGNNTDIDGINLAEGCAPSGINDAIRELMAQLKDFQAGTAGDSFNGPVGTTTAAAGAFTNLSASGTFALTGDQVQISEGGTGQTTANAAFNALAPSQATHAGKYLKTDGTNTSWDALDISTADITGTLPVANGGTGVTSSTGTGSVVLSASPTFTGTVNAAALTLSSNFTLSGGTANGVAYLNGSKVLTTGSALTFDGTSLTQFASTTGVLAEFRNSSSATQNSNVNATNNAGVSLGLRVFGSAAGSYGMLSANSTMLYTSASELNFIADNASGAIKWGLSGAIEAMRLTSTGLGIGTSSPGVKLDVSGADGVRSRVLATSGGTSGLILSSAGNTAYTIKAGNADNSLRIDQDGTDRLTLASGGNLGLGVTPSAWGSAYKAFEGNYGTNFSFDTNNPAAIVATNAYHNGTNWIYKISSYGAMRFAAEASNGFKFFTAPSGTAGNAISFTQAMTLTAAGDLGLGTTTPTNSAGYSTLSLNGSTGGQLVFQTGGTYKQSIYSSSTDLNFYNSVAGNLTFSTNATERARITSGGQLLINTTTDGAAAGGRLHITGNTVQSAASIRIGTDGYPGWYFTNSAGTKVGDIVINNASTTYNTTSDYRLKNITGPVTNSGAYIDSLKPVEGTWKSNGSIFVGLIAHEAQEVSRTQVATGTKDGEELQGMDYSNSEFIANIIAELQSLRARVAALETK